MHSGATFDASQTYRYSLWREWEETAPRVGFVMLNPSRADASVNDPTIRRCIALARSWGYGSLEVVNLFAYRTAHPEELRQAQEPIGTDNDRYLHSLAERVEQIVLAWGNWGNWQGRDRAVLEFFPATRLWCLGLTRLGQPKHPLYLPASVVPLPFGQSVS